MINQTSVIGGTHLVDSILSLGVDVNRVFAPEHGFGSTADAQENTKEMDFTPQQGYL